MKFTSELQDAVRTMLKKYEEQDTKRSFPKEGSTKIYTDNLIPLLLLLPGNPQKLFWVLVKERDEWNQVHKNKKEMGSAYMKTYYKTNFSTDIHKLIDLGMVAMIGYVPMISPFLVLPKNTPQINKAIQDVWEELVLNQAHKV